MWSRSFCRPRVDDARTGPKRVIVAHGSHIAMQNTFAEALADVFGGESPVTTAPEAQVEDLSPLPNDIAGVRWRKEHYQAAQECLTAGDWLVTAANSKLSRKCWNQRWWP